MKFTKTRISPTPSGFLHLGNATSFLITASLAKHYGAKVLLRIDDIDKERVKKKYVEDIFKTLEFLGIPWDEGPRNYQEYKAKYSQIHRMKHYQKALEQLKKSKKLFACDCSRRKISSNSPSGGYPGTCEKRKLSFEDKEASWRLFTSNKAIPLNDISRPGFVMTIPALLRDFVVRRKDGLPAYQLTSVIDDMLDKIDFVVRGKDLMPSSIAQLFLSEKLPQNPLKETVFFHHRLMPDTHNRKMSKSSGADSIQHLIKTGTDKSTVYQKIADFMGLQQPVSDFEEFQTAYLLDLKSKEDTFL
jgi:glutamyl/glutaminyl-tRNA synthetase